MLHIGYITTILLLEPLFLLHTHSYKLVQVPLLSQGVIINLKSGKLGWQ
jgi:hypothetical protein